MKKRFLSAVLAGIMTVTSAVGMYANADTLNKGDWGSIKWNVDDVGTLTITGDGVIPDNGAPWNSNKINNVIISDGITGIGAKAFSGRSSIERISIGKDVEIIGENAFLNCTGLTSIKLPEGLKYIESEAFMGCGASSIIIPSTTVKIADYSFYNSRIVNAKIPGGVKQIGEYAFAGGNWNYDSAAYDAIPLKRVEISEGVERIGNCSFSKAQNLATVKLPQSLTSIGKGAFEYCASLNEIIIPEQIDNIAEGTFNYCINLTVVYIPKNVISIGAAAFQRCNKLTTIYYEGTEDEWYNIVVGAGNEVLNSAAKKYNYNIKTGTTNPTTPTTPTQPTTEKAILTYSANGGIEPPSPVTAKVGDKVKISEEKLTRLGYQFLGWAKDESAYAPEYTGGEEITLTGNTTLYAVWKNTSYSTMIVLTIDKNEALVNGEAVYNDVAPIITNSRTMLPARFVAEKLGATVSWDDAARKVIITGSDGKVIEIIVDSATAYVNGAACTLDSPAFISNSRTYTPVKFICDNLGADVKWDGEKRTVTITK